MTVGIDDTDFYLQEGPGPVTNGTNPDNYTTYTSAQGNWQIGAKRAEYCDTNNGWTIFEYARVQGGAEGNANGGAVKDRLGLDTALAATGVQAFQMDGGEMLLNGRIAILLGTITAAEFTAGDRYGWVWAGGVAPVDLITGTDGIYLTDGNVAAGSGMDLVDNSGPAYFGVIGTSDVGIVGAFALADDSNIS